MKNLLYRSLGYEKANDTEIKWQILPSLFLEWALGFGELCLESTCMCHLVAILWNYMFRRQKQEAKWANVLPMFLKNPCFKNKNETEKNQFCCKLQTGADWKDNFIQGCHLWPNKKGNWKYLEYTSVSSNVEFEFWFVFIWIRLMDKEDEGIRSLAQDCFKSWLISRHLAKGSCNIFFPLTSFPSLF